MIIVTKQLVIVADAALATRSANMLIFLYLGSLVTLCADPVRKYQDFVWAR